MRYSIDPCRFGRAQVRAVLPTSLPALSIRLQIYLTAPTDRPVRLLTLEGKSGNRFSLAVDGNAIIASNEQPQDDGGVAITREDAELAAPSGWSAVRFDAVQLDATPNLYLSSDLEDQGPRFATTIGRVGTVDYVMVGPETTTAGGPVDVSIDDVAVYER